MDRAARRLAVWLRGLRPMPIVTVAIAGLLISVSTLGSLAFHDFSDPRPSGALTAEESLHAASAILSAAGTLDTDLDGIADAVENFLAGSDPFVWNTSGSRLPDGWLFRHGYDPRDPSIEAHPAASPPASALPPIYGNQWPARFTPTLWEVYSHGRPGNWSEATLGPFDNQIAPTEWDNSGDGIPDGWLIHYGLDPLDANVSGESLAGPGGLTLREAFEHNTDPTSLDSDRDGLPDREELLGPRDPRTGNRFPPSFPSAFTTGGSGVCDGYLVAHGLDPSDPRNAYGDPARSGATTKQRFDWSHDRFGHEACTAGKGLDPTRQSTVGGPIPDGWLLRYGLDPLDAKVAAQVTGSSEDHADGPWQARTEPPTPDEPMLPHLEITVLDEYLFGRPGTWNEAVQGPWWGGTDPSLNDTDGDGLPDVVEKRGFYVQVATDVGPDAPVRSIHVFSDPTRVDSDGDGLTDFEEISRHGTDPSRRDTDMDSIPDAVELDDKYGLDPLRADTAGDFLRDGTRLEMLESRARQYAAGDFSYDYPGQPGVTRFVTDWACQTRGAEEALGALVQGGAACAQALGPSGLAALFGPGGNLNARLDPDDGKPVPNVLNDDIDGDGLLNGWEVDPSLYDRASPFPSIDDIPRRATDPMNPDTDGDLLPDGWEVLHGEARHDGIPGGYYNLDPSRWDSDGNGVSDADEDPDGDGMEWPFYVQEGGAIVLKNRTEPFPNLLEYLAGTDPNRFDSDRDGLGDGWKVFWGNVYPTLDDDLLGLFHPPAGPAGLQIQGPRPRVGTDQSDVVLEEGTYRRFVFSLDGRNEMVEKYGERLVQSYTVNIPDLAGDVKERVVHEVAGTVRFGFNEAHDAGTNPYLQDTSGDGIPDWWALFYSQLPLGTPGESRCVDAGLDSTIHYTADETLSPESGLTIREAYLHGTNPMCKDTDMDGLSDGYEVERAGILDPLDPSDARDVAGDADSDRDGLSDVDEIIGVRHGHLAGSVRTDPLNPDTDGDGLLDGGTIAQEDPKWANLYRDLGIAYSTAGFWGEADVSIGTSPRNPDDSGTGVPAGWLVSRGESATAPSGDYGYDYYDYYAARMPTWWDQDVRGPWWGGFLPGEDEELEAFAHELDRDNDGLRDIDDNGDPYEDPMPFANTHNAWRAIDWDRYPISWVASLKLPELPAADARPNDADLHPLVRRLLAQSYLDPKTVGTNYVHFGGSSPPSAQPVCLLDPVILGDGVPTTVVVKGANMELKGKVVTCGGNPQGIPGVTVEVRLGSPAQSFGAGFTDPNGDFRFPFNVSSEQRVLFPPGAPVVLRGSTSGPVEWFPKPANVSPGDGELGVQTYAAPATPPGPYHHPMLASARKDLDITVKAGASLEITVPETAPTGPSFLVKYRLTDSSGTPLPHDVRFKWLGEWLPTSRPDAQGRGEVTLAAPHGKAGLQALTATSHPLDDEKKFVDGATSPEKKIRLLNPVNVEVTSAPQDANAGETIAVRGHVRLVHSGQGVGNLPVTLQIIGGPQPIPAVELTTGPADSLPAGSFEGLIQLPASLAGGAYHLVVQASQGDSTLPAQVSEGIDIRGLPRFTEVRTTDILQGTLAEVSGRLLDRDAGSVVGAEITIRLHDVQRTATTDGTGRFRVTLPGDLPVRPALQTLSFAGDDLYAPAHNRTERAVLANTTMTIPAGALARGASIEIPINLVTGGGDPVQGASIQVTWGDESPVQVITDAAGRGVFHRDGHPTDPLGTFVVRGRYEGSRDGGLAPSPAAVATWSVSTRAEFSLPAGTFEAGQSLPPGVLRDAGTLKPLLNARVTLAVDGNRSVVTTDAEGEFRILEDVGPTSAPRHVEVTASFAGDAIYKALSNTTSLVLRTPTRLEVAASQVIVMGRQTIATVHVSGLDGAAVDGGLVNITLDGEVVGSANVTDGVARVPVLVASTQRPGPRTFTVDYLGSDDYAPSSVDHPTSLKQPVVLSLSAEPVQPGQAAKVKVLVHSGGDPIAFSLVYLQIEGVAGGLVAMTDEAGVATFNIEQPLAGARMSARFEGAVQLSPAQAAGALRPATREILGETAVQWLSVAVIAASVALSALAAVVYRMRRSRLAPVLRQARRILGARGPHAQQILKAYQILQDAAIGYGFLEHDAPTPRGLEAAIAQQVPAAARASLGRLVGLFEAARYGKDEIGPGHRAAALDALKAIQRDLQVDAGLTWWRRPRPGGVST